MGEAQLLHQTLLAYFKAPCRALLRNLRDANASHVVRTIVLTSSSILLSKVLFVQTRVSLRLATFPPLYPSHIKDFQQHLSFPLMPSPPFGMQKIRQHHSLWMSYNSIATALSKQLLAFRCRYMQVKLNGWIPSRNNVVHVDIIHSFPKKTSINQTTLM